MTVERADVPSRLAEDERARRVVPRLGPADIDTAQEDDGCADAAARRIDERGVRVGARLP